MYKFKLIFVNEMLIKVRVPVVVADSDQSQPDSDQSQPDSDQVNITQKTQKVVCPDPPSG